MYEQHWGLQKTPFGNDRSAESYYVSSAHQSALLKLRFLVDYRRGAGLLVGPSGVGKTRLLQALLPESQDQHSSVVRIVYPLMNPTELLSLLVSELATEESTSVGQSLDVLIQQIVECFRSMASRGTPAVIVIDDAHAITDRQVFQALQLLLNFQQVPGCEFTLILAGQPELVGMTRRLPQLDDRISIPCILTAMSAEETSAYVGHRLQAAGATEPIFSRNALQTIHELSGGLPRRINRLCDFALLVGYAEGRGLIDEEHIEGVCTELNLARAA